MRLSAKYLALQSPVQVNLIVSRETQSGSEETNLTTYEFAEAIALSRPAMSQQRPLCYQQSYPQGYPPRYPPAFLLYTARQAGVVGTR